MFPADSPMTMIDGVLVKLDKSLLRPKYQHGDPIQIRFIVENQRRDSIYVVTSERRFGCFPESNHHVLSFDKNYYQDEAFDFPALWRLKPQDSVILEGTYSVIAYSDEGLHTFKLSIGYLTEEALQKINDQIS
ncbi:MAG TPA: hypothetical protein VEF04_03540, partial [Blastocatellia bacterium]|nr:hypothetical protein [Blastocatellia bacterium]